MSNKELIQIEVKNPKSLGDINGVEVFLTKQLVSILKKEKNKSGESLLWLFKRGRALQGFKHLIQTIREKNKTSDIVFTHDDITRKSKSRYFISYKQYRKFTGTRFFALYRQTGIDGAKYFLNFNFPKDFKYDKAMVSEDQLKQIDKKFPDSIKKLSVKKKNQQAILEETSVIIKRLEEKEKVLDEEKLKLEQIQKESNIFIFNEKIKELKDRLGKKYSESSGKNSWQTWIYNNNWMFGINYQKPIEKEKINIKGVMPDYIFPTIDDFLDILEIKLPTRDVILEDLNHRGSYRWDGETNKAIGQVINYLHSLELHQDRLMIEINRKYNLDLSVIKPRAFILIGNSSGWSKDKLEALRKLNYSLHGIEILTYADLLNRAQEIVNIYNKDLK